MTRTAASLLILAGGAWLSGCISGGADVATWQPDLSASLRVSGGGSSGDKVDLQADVGLDDQESTDIERFFFQMGPSRYEFGRWGLAVDGQTSIDSSFDFGGSTYTAGDVVETQFDLEVWRAAYLFCPKLGSFKVGVGLALQWWDVEAELDNETAAFDESFDESYPIPALTARLDIPISLFISFTSQADYLEVDLDDVEGRFLDSTAGFRFSAPKTFSAFAGYRIMNADLAIEDNSVDLDFEGVVFSAAVSW